MKFLTVYLGRCRFASPGAGLGVDPNNVGRGRALPPNICADPWDVAKGLLWIVRCNPDPSGVDGIGVLAPPPGINLFIKGNDSAAQK